jgi:hypothetical protein
MCFEFREILIFGEGKAGKGAFESRVKFRKEQLSHYFRLIEILSLFEGQIKQGISIR